MTNLIASAKKRIQRVRQSLGLCRATKTSAYSTQDSIACLDQSSAELTMLFPAESSYLRNFAMARYRGLGELVDLGAWAGSSTLALGQGLAMNDRVDCSRKRIHAYDIFIWEQWMSDIPWSSSLVKGYQNGDSFLPLYEKQIAAYEHLIATYPGDLNAMAEFPRDIEYLFVDVMKSWQLANTTIQKYFTKLIPGISIVHHQDYNHYFTPWIHLLMYRLRDHFVFEQYVEGTPSTVFAYTDEIPAEKLQQDYSFDSFSADEFEAAFEYSIRNTGKSAWPSIASSRVMAYIHQGKWDIAEKEYLPLKSRYGTENYDVAQIEKILRERSFR